MSKKIDYQKRLEELTEQKKKLETSKTSTKQSYGGGVEYLGKGNAKYRENLSYYKSLEGTVKEAYYGSRDNEELNKFKKRNKKYAEQADTVIEATKKEREKELNKLKKRNKNYAEQVDKDERKVKEIDSQLEGLRKQQSFIENKINKNIERKAKEKDRRELGKLLRKEKIKNLRNELKSFTERDNDPNKGLSYLDFFEKRKKDISKKQKEPQAEPLKSYNEVITFQHIPTGQVSQFTAFVEVYRDSYTCNWQSTPVFGRMDPIMAYGGTKRSMTLNFKIMSASAREAYRNIQNLQVLIRSLYPTYNKLNYDASGFSSNLSANTMGAAPLVRIAWSNLISNNRGQGIIAAIQSLGVDPIKEVGMIGLDETLTTDAFYEPTLTQRKHKNISTGLLPLGLTVSLTFQVLHDYSLGHFDSEDDHFNSFPYGLETDSLLGDSSLPPEITNSRQFLLEERVEKEAKSRSFKSPQRARDHNLLTAFIGGAFDTITGENNPED